MLPSFCGSSVFLFVAIFSPDFFRRVRFLRFCSGMRHSVSLQVFESVECEGGRSKVFQLVVLRRVSFLIGRHHSSAACFSASFSLIFRDVLPFKCVICGLKSLSRRLHFTVVLLFSVVVVYFFLEPSVFQKKMHKKLTSHQSRC